ncbi:MOSC domain-containing protein [Xanthomonas sp. D-109]|uniref:MOSC domain-containing protein n=1 Tax=Xanthomonas sp. D-109 TaxID=2821274 RepID=UPI001ADB1C13|nr:MOSC domain-containing protein [Xanthomonas sp. D-109]MBO9882016.1 MOSC domain-containing protein [Xanthomonas sp. D-109]
MTSSDSAVASWTIDAVLVGRAQAFIRPGSRSAIDKRPQDGRLRIGPEGLELDEQGDRRVHGGPDKALHHYPRDHYPAWREELGAHALLDAPGAFGENLSSCGVTEADLCLGDRLRLGTALVEVSQSRQPCWKLSDRFGVPALARRVQDSGRTGWYYRVLQPGEVAAGDRLELLERPYPQWPLARLVGLLYRREIDLAQLQDVLALPLVPNWRTLFERRLAQRAVENWDKRLLGQAPE